MTAEEICKDIQKQLEEHGFKSVPEFQEAEQRWILDVSTGDEDDCYRLGIIADADTLKLMASLIKTLKNVQELNTKDLK